MQSKSFTMHTNSEYEKIAIIVILAGCGVAIALAFAVLICCQFLVKPKYSRYSCHPNSQIVVFERQTTTSDENNAEYYSCCYEDSFYQQQQCDNETNGDTINTTNTVIAQTHCTTSNSVQTTPQPQQRSSSPQVKFAPRPIKNRKASLPSKLASFQLKEDNCSKEIKEPQRRASAGIIRQNNFEDIDEGISCRQTAKLDTKIKDQSDNKEVISNDALRKQYRELWQLRATFEAEEMELSNESSDSLPSLQQQKLTKNDSGYKSIERRDYSIDYKTEYIFRQFTATTPQRHSIHHQQSIKEEQESDIQATFV